MRPVLAKINGEYSVSPVRPEGRLLISIRSMFSASGASIASTRRPSAHRYPADALRQRKYVRSSLMMSHDTDIVRLCVLISQYVLGKNSSMEDTGRQIERKTINLWPDAGRQLGLSKNATYEGARRGEIPGAIPYWLPLACFRSRHGFNGRYKVTLRVRGSPSVSAKTAKTCAG